ncbi:DNA polymerase I [Leptospirillum ferriphilum YSK]|uniref:DNA polymerase I n=2 Tax=Leptospirillum ferriphilum TaxID=178606 RepID=A0A059XSW4_9BACT|nr:DNA polymerase I [Leptospirillum ferriphilum YSK]
MDSPSGRKKTASSVPAWVRDLPPSTLVLMDGFGYIFRAYHSRVTFVTRAGLPTGAITVFGNMLLSVLKELSPSAMAVVFESRTGNVRSEILPEIKANRPEPPSDFLQQIPYIERLIRGIGVPLLSTDGYEADDTIAALALKWLNHHDRTNVPCHVVVLSSDKDLLTLVSDRVWVYDPMTKKVLGPSDVREKWGVEPWQIPDLLALTGDTADNIPGVPGIGQKTAAKLLGNQGTIDTLYEDLDNVVPERIRTLLREHRERVFRNKKVTVLHSDLALSLEPESLSLSPPDMDSLKSLLQELEAPGLLSRVHRTLELREPSLAREEGKRRQSSEVRLPFQGDLPQMSGCPGAGIDLVDDSGFWVHDGDQANFYPFSSEEEVLKTMSAWRDEGKAVWCFDQTRLYRKCPRFFALGIPFVFDATIAAYLLEPGHRDYLLENLAARYFLTETSDRTRLVRNVLSKLWEDAVKEGLLELVQSIEIPLGRILYQMEVLGIRIDRQALESARESIEALARELEEEIYRLAGSRFTILSPKQVGEILYGKLGLPTARKGKTGYSTDEETLTGLSALHPLPEKILAYRQMKKLLSTYVDPISRGVDAQGRLHGQFNQTVTATGRLSSSNPNLQNIPMRSPAGREIRKCFIAGENRVLLSADYSQIELRLLAHFSEDPELMAVFERNEDIHARTARLLFGDPVTPETRRKAKTINFGILYGMSAFSLSQDLGVEPQEAQAFIDRYFGAFPKVGPLFDSILEEAKKTGEVRTILGRKRRIPELFAPDRRSREYGERMAVNTVLQGSAADLIKKSMVDFGQVRKDRPEVGDLLVQVHDELLFEVREDNLEDTSGTIRSLMEGALRLKVPLIVQVGHGKNWVDAHPG